MSDEQISALKLRYARHLAEGETREADEVLNELIKLREGVREPAAEEAAAKPVERAVDKAAVEVAESAASVRRRSSAR